MASYSWHRIAEMHKFNLSAHLPTIILEVSLFGVL